jgi:hypothetical protein
MEHLLDGLYYIYKLLNVTTIRQTYDINIYRTNPIYTESLIFSKKQSMNCSIHFSVCLSPCVPSGTGRGRGTMVLGTTCGGSTFTQLGMGCCRP